MSLAERLLDILGEQAGTIEVDSVINGYDLRDVYDDPPFRRYVGSAEKGIDILFENDKILDIQIYVQRSKTHAAFSEKLPFQIQVGMTDKQVHALLGKPKTQDEVGSRYTVLEGAATLTIVYNKSNVVSYLSIRRT